MRLSNKNLKGGEIDKQINKKSRAIYLDIAYNYVYTTDTEQNNEEGNAATWLKGGVSSGRQSFCSN